MISINATFAGAGTTIAIAGGSRELRFGKVVAVSDTLWERLDAILDSQQQRRDRREAEERRADQEIADKDAERRCSRGRFHSEVRSLIGQAADRANQHLAQRPERFQFCDVSEFYTGPLYEAEASCNPIAYELRAGGKPAGATLIVELTHDNMVDAYLGPLRPCTREADRYRIEFGWRTIPLRLFDATAAADLLVRYVCAVAMRAPFGTKFPG